MRNQSFKAIHQAAYIMRYGGIQTLLNKTIPVLLKIHKLIKKNYFIQTRKKHLINFPNCIHIQKKTDEVRMEKPRTK